MKNQAHNKTKKKLIRIRVHESGGVLVLMAISILTLIGAVALGLDTYRLYTFKAQLRSNVSLAALAAIEGYADSSYSLSLDQRKAIARGRAEAVLESNSYVGYEDQSAMGAGMFEQNGSITLGNWMYTSLCMGAETVLDNCFDEIEDFLETNAIRLTIRSLEDQRPKGLLSSSLGFKSFRPISATAIAWYDEERAKEGVFPFLVVFVD
jgi:uncharacterized membrane protein